MRLALAQKKTRERAWKLQAAKGEGSKERIRIQFPAPAGFSKKEKKKNRIEKRFDKTVFFLH